MVQATAVEQLQRFRNQEGLFGRPAAAAAAARMAGHARWSAYGASAPALQHCVVRVLAQVRLSSSTWMLSYKRCLSAESVCTLLCDLLAHYFYYVQPSSACACERNWSTHDYIHSKKRNRRRRPSVQRSWSTSSATSDS